jgi:hypothetical protein
MTEYVETAEEKAFHTLLDEKRGEITEAARAFIKYAADSSHACYLYHDYAFEPVEYLMAEHNMLAQAYLLTQHDREVLGKVGQAAKAASESLDKDDFETPAGFHRTVVADRYRYYAMISQMVEDALKPTDPSKIYEAQFDLWLEYEKWYLRVSAATGDPTQQRSDESA